LVVVVISHHGFSILDARPAVSIAFLRGKDANVDLMTIMRKGLVLTGSLLRPRSTREKSAIASALRREVWPKIEAGAIRPVIDRVFDVTEVGACHARMERSEHIGKMLLEVRA
jgi:NADPH:quinone reductase